MPQLSGISRLPHIALTYNACPDPRSTPQLLDLLARYEVHATFFLLARRAQQQPALVAAMVEAGHEIGVHGWNHGCVALSRPGTIPRDLHAARNTLEDLTGAPVARYRPPYGVLTTESLLAAQALGLQTVLWSSWGRDWTSPRHGPQHRAHRPQDGSPRRDSALAPLRPRGNSHLVAPHPDRQLAAARRVARRPDLGRSAARTRVEPTPGTGPPLRQRASHLTPQPCEGAGRHRSRSPRFSSDARTSFCRARRAQPETVLLCAEPSAPHGDYADEGCSRRLCPPPVHRRGQRLNPEPGEPTSRRMARRALALSSATSVPG